MFLHLVGVWVLSCGLAWIRGDGVCDCFNSPEKARAGLLVIVTCDSRCACYIGWPIVLVVSLLIGISPNVPFLCQTCHRAISAFVRSFREDVNDVNINITIMYAWDTLEFLPGDPRVALQGRLAVDTGIYDCASPWVPWACCGHAYIYLWRWAKAR
jgi:hypothetical protein